MTGNAVPGRGTPGLMIPGRPVTAQQQAFTVGVLTTSIAPPVALS